MSEAAERDRFRGCLLGLAAGDALGTTLEFKRPGSFEPIDDMVGGGPHRVLSWVLMRPCRSAAMHEPDSTPFCWSSSRRGIVFQKTDCFASIETV